MIYFVQSYIQHCMFKHCMGWGPIKRVWRPLFWTNRTCNVGPDGLQNWSNILIFTNS